MLLKDRCHENIFFDMFFVLPNEACLSKSQCFWAKNKATTGTVSFRSRDVKRHMRQATPQRGVLSLVVYMVAALSFAIQI